MIFDGATRTRVDTGEVEINCVVTGHGPPILLLHGYPQNVAQWAALVPLLSSDLTVVCGDLRGYGDSSKPHANPDGTAFKTQPIAVDAAWHTWRVTWNRSGIYFWEDFVDGAPPYFSVPAAGIEDLNDPVRMWPFNDVGYTLFPILNLAVGGSGGGDPASGSYPAEMLGDWVRVF